jgi:hypothetical protein
MFRIFLKTISGASSTIRNSFYPLLNFGIIAPTHHDSDTLIECKTNKQASGSSERVAWFFVNCLAQNGYACFMLACDQQPNIYYKVKTLISKHCREFIQRFVGTRPQLLPLCK